MQYGPAVFLHLILLIFCLFVIIANPNAEGTIQYKDTLKIITITAESRSPANAKPDPTLTGQATSAESEETDTSEQDTGAEESDITSEQQGLADKAATSVQQRVSCSIFDPAAAHFDGAGTRLDSEYAGRRRYAGTGLGRGGKERIIINITCPAKSPLDIRVGDRRGAIDLMAWPVAGNIIPKDTIGNNGRAFCNAYTTAMACIVPGNGTALTFKVPFV